MNINWKARFTSKTFWVATASAIVLLSQQLGLKIFPNNWSDILNTVLSLFTILGIIVDPSTPGINDLIKQPLEVKIDTENLIDKVVNSISKDTVQASNDTSASSKTKVDNPDNVQVVGQEVNHTSATIPQ